METNPRNRSSLLVVDVQQGFTTLCPAELPVPGGLEAHRFQTVWRKGYERDHDAYALTAQHPGFAALLRASGVEHVWVCGIATNICCFFAARDLVQAGFRVSLVEDASAGIDVPPA